VWIERVLEGAVLLGFVLIGAVLLGAVPLGFVLVEATLSPYRALITNYVSSPED